MCHHETTYYDCCLCGKEDGWKRVRVGCAEAKGKNGYGFGQCSAALPHGEVEVMSKHVSVVCEGCKTREAQREAERKVREDVTVARGGT